MRVAGLVRRRGLPRPFEGRRPIFHVPSEHLPPRGQRVLVRSAVDTASPKRAIGTVVVLPTSRGEISLITPLTARRLVDLPYRHRKRPISQEIQCTLLGPGQEPCVRCLVQLNCQPHVLPKG